MLACSLCQSVGEIINIKTRANFTQKKRKTPLHTDRVTMFSLHYQIQLLYEAGQSTTVNCCVNTRPNARCVAKLKLILPFQTNLSKLERYFFTHIIMIIPRWGTQIIFTLCFFIQDLPFQKVQAILRDYDFSK